MTDVALLNDNSFVLIDVHFNRLCGATSASDTIATVGVCIDVFECDENWLNISGISSYQIDWILVVYQATKLIEY